MLAAILRLYFATWFIWRWTICVVGSRVRPCRCVFFFRVRRQPDRASGRRGRASVPNWIYFGDCFASARALAHSVHFATGARAETDLVSCRRSSLHQSRLVTCNRFTNSYCVLSLLLLLSASSRLFFYGRPSKTDIWFPFSSQK